MRAILTAGEKQFDIAFAEEDGSVSLRTSITAGELNERKIARLVDAFNRAITAVEAKAPPNEEERRARLQKTRCRLLAEVEERRAQLAALQVEIGDNDAKPEAVAR